MTKINTLPEIEGGENATNHVLRALEPLLRFLQYVGVLVPFSCEGVSPTKRRVSKLWTILCFVLTIAYVIRHVVYVSTELSHAQWNKGWPLHAICFGWYGITLCGSVVFIIQTWMDGSCLDKSFPYIERYDKKYGLSEACVAKELQLARRMTILIVFMGGGVMLIIFANAYLPVSADIFQMLVWPFPTQLGALYLLILCHMNAVPISAVAMPSMLCYSLKRRFEQLNADAQESCQQNRFADEVTQLRERFAELVQVVRAMDKFIGLLIGCVFTGFIPLACFMVYLAVVFIREQASTVELVTAISMLTTNITFIAILLYFAPTLHLSAHGLKTVLHKSLKTSASGHQRWAVEQRIELQLLINQLNYEDVGATTFGLYIITKDTALTIFSFYLTYIVITLQFL